MSEIPQAAAEKAVNAYYGNDRDAISWPGVTDSMAEAIQAAFDEMGIRVEETPAIVQPTPKLKTIWGLHRRYISDWVRIPVEPSDE